MRLGLKQHKLDELINSLYEVSDPSHVRYGQHLSKSEVNALVAPHVDTVEIVNAWLAHHGVDHTAVDRTDAGEWITMVVSVEQAERMLGLSFLTGIFTWTANQVPRRCQIRSVQPHRLRRLRPPHPGVLPPPCTARPH